MFYLFIFGHNDLQTLLQAVLSKNRTLTSPAEYRFRSLKQFGEASFILEIMQYAI